MNTIIWVWLVLGSSLDVFGANLKPFTTDGCSSFPDGTMDQQSLWVHCCIRHDLAYWKGGLIGERTAADQALERCVTRVGEPEIARIMLAGVRVGGSPYFPTPYRWGYGWPYLRGYKALSKEEKEQVAQQLTNLKMMIEGLANEVIEGGKE
ncbi:MAG: FAD-binding oxidoreductase [Proteobacteria bacterium]|nr:FAD-binding oxidoreductase [Pseudomonadota bacterium]MBU1687201.1 FAD-binding oxidoreductase [Pseudomonadota bacterium]